MGWLRKDRPALQLSRLEALACIPVKNRHVREQRLDSGEVVVLYPLTARPWMATLARWLGVRSTAPRTAKLQLDPLGSGVWGMFDGRTSLRRIAAAFAAMHRLERKEAEVAVSQFVRELGRRGVIGLRRDSAPEGSPVKRP